MMHKYSVRVTTAILQLMWSGIALSQPQHGAVTHWDDRSSMECPFIFQQETLLEWNQIDPPPITIETTAAIARLWGEQKNLTNVVTLSFRLIMVSPWGHDYPMWVMFVKYLGAPPRTLIISGDDYHWLAITPTGTVVEPTCEGEP